MVDPQVRFDEKKCKKAKRCARAHTFRLQPSAMRSISRYFFVKNQPSDKTEFY